MGVGTFRSYTLQLIEYLCHTGLQVADNLTLQEAALQQIRATKATMPLGPRHGMGAVSGSDSGYPAI